MNIREITEAKIQVLSEKKNKDGSLNILAPWIMTGQRNRNGRLYGLPLIQREVAKFQDRIKSGSVIGSADHPGGAFTTLDTASHIITKLSLDKNGQGWMEAKLLPTSKGKNVIEIIKAGGQLGISARGAGTISPSGIVQSDYKLLGIDIVTNPSEKTAVFDRSNIFESLDFEGNNKGENMKNLMGISEKYVDEMMTSCFEVYVRDEGFKGNFEDFKKGEGRFILAAILESEGKFETAEKALEYLEGKGFEQTRTIIDNINRNKEAYLEDLEEGGKIPDQTPTEEAIDAKIMSFFNEAVSSGFKGTISEFKEKFPAIVESASEGKIVEKKEESKTPFKSKCSWGEIKLSGYKGTMQEYREEFPNVEIMIEEAPKPIVEKTLRERAGIIFTGMMRDNPKSSLILEDIVKLLEEEKIKKADKRLRQKAIYIVNASLVGSGSIPTQTQLKEMVEMEIENLKEQRQEMREKNWQAYQKLLD